MCYKSMLAQGRHDSPDTADMSVGPCCSPERRWILSAKFRSGAEAGGILELNSAKPTVGRTRFKPFPLPPKLSAPFEKNTCGVGREGMEQNQGERWKEQD